MGQGTNIYKCNMSGIGSIIKKLNRDESYGGCGRWGAIIGRVIVDILSDGVTAEKRPEESEAAAIQRCWSRGTSSEGTRRATAPSQELHVSAEQQRSQSP